MGMETDLGVQSNTHTESDISDLPTWSSVTSNVTATYRPGNETSPIQVRSPHQLFNNECARNNLGDLYLKDSLSTKGTCSHKRI